MTSAMLDMGKRARAAARELALAETGQKNRALTAMAAEIRKAAAAILAANLEDVKSASAKDLKSSFIDRLTLNPARLEAMAKGLEDIAALPDPVGKVSAEWTQPNGLRFQRVQVPIGVIGIIFESRPNVTADAGALAMKSGNAAILRGGSDGFNTSMAIADALRRGLAAANLPVDAIQMVATTDRESVGEMLKGLDGNIDLIVPRGGKNLVARVQAEARVPVFSHLEGINHVYIDQAADIEMAKAIVLNSKMRRTGVCGAAETILIDNHRQEAVKPLVEALLAAGCEVRGDKTIQATDAQVKQASDEDWSTEYPRCNRRNEAGGWG